ncbi:MAG: hypothetical protein IPN53_25145 [Comamonadaceae bacterium]|nr:hypothetical protein [Comamonadaceae bacterium]
MIAANENGLDSREVQPVKTYQKTPADDKLENKRLATITAQMALAGHVVHKLETGFLVSRWGQTRVCPDLACLIGFARRVGASHD